jgi:hypothetical protein
LDLAERSILAIDVQQGADRSIRQVGLLGHDRVAVVAGGEIIVVRFSLDEKEYEEEARFPFRREIFALEGSLDGETIYIGYDGGLRALRSRSGEARSIGQPGGAMVSMVRCHPRLDYILVALGFKLGPTRMAIYNADGNAQYYLPDEGEEDTLRFAWSGAWSPSGDRLAVTDRGGYLSIFERTLL